MAYKAGKSDWYVASFVIIASILLSAFAFAGNLDKQPSISVVAVASESCGEVSVLQDNLAASKVRCANPTESCTNTIANEHRCTTNVANACSCQCNVRPGASSGTWSCSKCTSTCNDNTGKCDKTSVIA